MKLWKILAVASVAMAFTAAAQAQCGAHHAVSKSAEANQNTVPAGKTAAAKRAVGDKVAAAQPAAGTAVGSLPVSR